MITADTSVVIPALLDWHDHHAVARPAMLGVDTLPAHVLGESFSVLTRLPHGLSLPPSDATELLLEAFPARALTLSADGHRELLRTLAVAGVRGGAIYDGVVAATAAEADADLLTLDGRAAATYRAVGARFRTPT
ncbi:PIN domain-containing protein [Pseudonocardia sp.]|uniref:PIN domain-containing protein n=1 Tax=Pseudonocardia sp. TaxID=60912 RepID=UPI002638C42E|nr:PIN domain-containing protein [Pseudonocardia sp.]